MKRLPLIAVLSASVFMTACSLFPAGAKSSTEAVVETQAMATSKKPRNGDSPADNVTVQDESGSVVVQKVAFRPGVSSATVERLAKRYGCDGRTGAGLITERGPVEVYRMQCENGKNFIAQCELRQCRPMR